MEGASEYQKRTSLVEGRTVGIASYKVGNRFCARVDNVDPGAIIGRGQGPSRHDAEHEAVESAALTLKLRDASEAMRKSAERLPTGRGSR